MNNLLKVLSVSLLASSAISAADSRKEECKEECRAEGQPPVVSGIYAPEGVQPGERLLEEQPAAAVSVSAPAFSVIEGTDTKILLGCLETGDMQPYLENVKACAKTKLGAYIDSLLYYNGKFLSSRVVVGGYASASASACSASYSTARYRNAFKASVYANLDSLDLRGVPVPANASLKSIARFVVAIDDEIIQSVSTYIDALKPSNEGDFLGVGAAIGGVGQPADRTRDAFKNALWPVIFD